MSRHRIVIIGSGFAGLTAARRLKNADADITILARTSHHLFQPLLYQVATGILSEGDIAPTTREILRGQKNVTVLQALVEEIDVEARVVKWRNHNKHEQTEYDTLIVAAGAGQSYFGNDHFAVFAPGMKTIDDALELRARIFGAFELAEIETDPTAVEKLLTFVVVGAGPTGVEMAGQIRELASHTLKGEFRNIDPTKARVILVDGAEHPLPPFGEELGIKTEEALAKLGVEMKMNAFVTGVDSEGVTLKYKSGEEERIESVCKVWAAGVAASPLGRALGEATGAEVDRAGRVTVNKDLTLPDTQITVVHRSDKLAWSKNLTLDSLRGRDIITYPPTTPIGAEVSALMTTHGLSATRTYANDEITLGSMVESTPGTIGLALDTIGLAPFRELITKRLPEVDDDFHTVCLAFKTAAYKTRAVENFIEFTRSFEWDSKR